MTSTLVPNGEIKEKSLNISNKAFDVLYNTQWRREVNYLLKKGIKPTFVKYINEYKIKTYKYTKTPLLFMALAEFYTLVKNEKEFNSLVSKCLSITNGLEEIING